MIAPETRKVLTPSFLYSAEVGSTGGLCEACASVVKAIRFDATSLPVDELIFEAKHEGISLVVDVHVADRDKPGVERIHVWRTLICPWAPIRTNGPEYLVRFMRETIANVLAHETDESITLDGARVFDPHRALRSAESQ